MRLIDADALIPIMKYTTTDNEIGVFPIKIGFNAIKGVIDDAPTIDAVKVVRCGHCEWWRCNPNTKEYGVCKKVSYDDFEVVMDSDDFCSYGERREDGEA